MKPNEQWNFDLNLLISQQRKCAVCSFPITPNGKPKGSRYAHAHNVGEFRSLLCSQCMDAIGTRKKTKEITDYIEFHKKIPSVS